MGLSQVLFPIYQLSVGIYTNTFSTSCTRAGHRIMDMIFCRFHFAIKFNEKVLFVLDHCGCTI